jgi:RNA recognition motif. (a.k.a. RRM, RBD, or RNP domain)
LSKGYGFVQFSNYEESQKAITEMQGFMIRGKPIKVSPGFSRNSMNPPSSNGKGSSGGSQSSLELTIDGNNGPGGVFALGAGTMLGGLGVQIKSPDNSSQNGMVGMGNCTQPFAILPGQGMQTHNVSFQAPGLNTPQGLYAQSIADQQKLLYYQALLGGNLAAHPQAAQLMSMVSQGQGMHTGMHMTPGGMYGAPGLGLLGGRHND